MILDRKLSLENHTKNITKVNFFILGNKIHHLFINALISSLLDNCNAPLVGESAKSINGLQLVWSFAARILGHICQRTHPSSIIWPPPSPHRLTHWLQGPSPHLPDLPVRWPFNLSNLLKQYCSSRLLCSSSSLQQPRCKFKKLWEKNTLTREHCCSLVVEHTPSEKWTQCWRKTRSPNYSICTRGPILSFQTKSSETNHFR